MTAIETASEAETIERLDFEPTIGCEVKRPERCPAVASHMLRCRGCAWSLAVCAEHLVFIESEVARCGGVICTMCRLSAARIDDVLDLIPIGGAK